MKQKRLQNSKKERLPRNEADPEVHAEKDSICQQNWYLYRCDGRAVH